MSILGEKKKEEAAKLTPDLAGYRPDKDWWPDLTLYKRAMLLHGISLVEVKALLEKYVALYAGKKIT